MKTFERPNGPEKPEYRMPGNDGVLEAMRLRVLSRRAVKLAPGNNYVGLDRKRTAKVIKHPGSVAIEIDKSINKTEMLRRKAEFTWDEDGVIGALPYIRASEIRTKITQTRVEEIVSSRSFDASKQPAENTLGLGNVARILHEAKQLQSAEVA